MSQATLTQLVNAIAGDHIVGFFLVLARVAPLFVLAPFFSAKQIPSRSRGPSRWRSPSASPGSRRRASGCPADALAVTGLLVEQLLVGTAFAYALAAMFAALEVGGSFLDTVSGFSYGSLINPLTGTTSAVLARLYTMVGTMLFVSIGGDAYVLRGIGRTFDIVPLTSAPNLKTIVGGAVESFTTLFTAAVEVVGPILLALLVTDIAFGLVSRVVPQLNVFAVGLPVKVGVALLLVAAMLPFLGGWLTNSVQSAVGLALHEI